ncbi:MAG: ornithine cyclodeaminase family protein [Lawsonibacter sp.]|jgi:ornithine cyclodeaminase/alanine dehydrogenase-like protein (mu-crystallin family)
MSVDILFLNDEAMRELGAEDMQAVLHDVERAYSLFEAGDVICPGKVVMRFGDKPEDENVLGRINCMPGYIGGEYDMAGVKWIGSGPMNYKKGLPRASVTTILNDPDTKLPLCIADGTAVSAKRTGASGGMAMKLLSKQNATTITICGAGAQARTQLEAATIVRPSLQKVYIYDLYFDRAELFAQEMGAKYPSLQIIPVKLADLGNAVSDSDIVVTVTLADEPFIKADWIKPGCLIVHMAGHEVEYDCVRKADKIVVDFWDTIKHRMASTIALMWADGLIHDEDIAAEIGQIVNGKKTGRDNDEQIIYFNAVGAGILDLAVTTRCYRKALELGKGSRIPYWL